MKKSAKNHGQGARRRVQGGEQALGMVRMPKQIQFELSWRQKLRFQSNQNNSVTAITFKNLLDTVLLAGTAALGYDLFDFVKINKIELWATGVGASGLLSTVQTCSIEWSGIGTGSAGSGASVSETTLGTAVPLHLVARPPRGSLASMFQISSTDQAFVIRASGFANTVIVDLDVEFKNSIEVNPQAVANAITGATPGGIYFGGLDGARAAATIWPTVFLPAI